MMLQPLRSSKSSSNTDLREGVSAEGDGAATESREAVARAGWSDRSNMVAHRIEGHG